MQVVLFSLSVFIWKLYFLANILLRCHYVCIHMYFNAEHSRAFRFVYNQLSVVCSFGWNTCNKLRRLIQLNGHFFPSVNQLIQANTENAVKIELPRIWFSIRQNKNRNTLCHLGWNFDYEYINNLFGKYFPSLQLLSLTQMLLVLCVCVFFLSTVLFVGFSIQLLRICRVISMFFFSSILQSRFSTTIIGTESNGISIRWTKQLDNRLMACIYGTYVYICWHL